MAARTNLSAKNLFGVFFDAARNLRTKLAEHDAALDAVLGSGGQRETVTTAGAIAPTVAHTDVALSGTKVYTLAAGTKEGQLKTVRCLSAASVPVGSITGAFNNGGSAATTIAFTAVTFFVVLSWDATGAKWVIRYAVGATVS
jgi:hypothetical protein